MLRVHDYVHVYGAKTTWCIRQSLGSRCYVDRFAFHLSILYHFIYLFIFFACRLIRVSWAGLWWNSAKKYLICPLGLGQPRWSGSFASLSTWMATKLVLQEGLHFPSIFQSF